MTRRLAPAALVMMLAVPATARADTPSTMMMMPAADPDPWFGKDKALHFGLSAAVTGAGYGFTSLATPDIRLRIVFGAGTGILVGAAKELIDLAGVGTPSWKDFTWDLAGTAIGLGIAVSIDLAVRSLQPKAAAAR